MHRTREFEINIIIPLRKSPYLCIAIVIRLTTAACMLSCTHDILCIITIHPRRSFKVYVNSVSKASMCIITLEICKQMKLVISVAPSNSPTRFFFVLLFHNSCE